MDVGIQEKEVKRVSEILEDDDDGGGGDEEKEKKRRMGRSSSSAPSSPRGVFEIPISGSSDSDSITGDERSISFASSTATATTEDEDDGGAKKEEELRGGSGGSGALPLPPRADANGVQWRKFFYRIRRKSVKGFPVAPLLGSGQEILWKSRRILMGRRRRNSEANIDFAAEDFSVPKPSWRNFSLDELAEATNNFSSENLIGKGGHAEVYKGCLGDGEVVAIKRIAKKDKTEEDRIGNFLSELGMIAHINHPNAAKLIGFSSHGGLHLVLQYLPHGSLSLVLHSAEETLEWKTRAKVAIGVAEGLHYLHCVCKRRIIHRDITASNILLTEDFEPQISDFGLAKWLPEKCNQHVVFPVEGTFGYMAPEYFMHGVIDEKIDVFAFGVLLLEIITGRQAVDSSGQSLAMWAKPLLEENKIKEIVDPRLGDAYDVVEMERFMFVASSCIQHQPHMRPNMNKVLMLLKHENEMQKSTRKLVLDSSDVEDHYNSTTYREHLDRHMQLIME